MLDAKTNEDITAKVLTQILLDYEPVKLAMFSNELLTRAIRVNERLLKDFVDVYFRQAFEAFCRSQKQVDQMLRQTHHLTSVLPAAASSAANLLPPWMPLSAFLPSAPAPASEKNGDPGSAGVQNELAALREEVSKLKALFKLRSSSTRKKQKRFLVQTQKLLRKSFLTLDGIARRLDPDFNAWLKTLAVCLRRPARFLSFRAGHANALGSFRAGSESKFCANAKTR